MGSNGSKSFQQVGAVATGLTSWVSGARKRRAAGLQKLNESDQQVAGADSGDDESPTKMAKTENGSEDSSEEQFVVDETESKQLISNEDSDFTKAFDKVEENTKSNEVDHKSNGITPVASDVDEGVGLDAAGKENRLVCV